MGIGTRTRNFYHQLEVIDIGDSLGLALDLSG